MNPVFKEQILSLAKSNPITFRRTEVEEVYSIQDSNNQPLIHLIKTLRSGTYALVINRAIVVRATFPDDRLGAKLQDLMDVMEIESTCNRTVLERAEYRQTLEKMSDHERRASNFINDVMLQQYKEKNMLLPHEKKSLTR